MILPVLAMAFMPWAGQAASSGQREDAAQDAPVRTVADALAILQADNSGPKPAVSPGEWVVSDDYPAEAIRRGEQGLVGLALDVDATGRVTGCSIIATSGSAVLDEHTCKLLIARASFQPAQDVAGKPVAGRWQSRFRWELPRSDAFSWTLNVQYKVGSAGVLLACRHEAFGMPVPADDEGLCQWLRSTGGARLAKLGAEDAKPVSVFMASQLVIDGLALGSIQAPEGYRAAVRRSVSARFDAHDKIGECRAIVNDAEQMVEGGRCPLPPPQITFADHQEHRVEFNYIAATNGDPAALLQTME